MWSTTTKHFFNYSIHQDKHIARRTCQGNMMFQTMQPQPQQQRSLQQADILEHQHRQLFPASICQSRACCWLFIAANIVGQKQKWIQLPSRSTFAISRNSDLHLLNPDARLQQALSLERSFRHERFRHRALF